ncbi:hypothetical protein IKF57_01270 [Candidatus Saccharibacteria bacterium]|nr:hypothetical protein [Candidatus Saccharibacteria bacterium]
MKEEIFFSVVNCILLFLFGLVWVWSARTEKGKRRHIYMFASLADFALITAATLAVILSSNWTFRSEALFVTVSANALFSAIMHKKETN